MSDPFVGEVQIFGFTYAPRDWALCTGATVPLRQNTILFSLIGTMYGGNGTSTFQLPNLVNRTAVSQGTGTGLTPRVVGEPFGNNAVTLNSSEIPAHSHPMVAYSGGTTRSGTPSNGAGLGQVTRNTLYAPTGTAPNTNFSALAVTPAGNSGSHENRQPFLALNYSIALLGVFPSFS